MIVTAEAEIKRTLYYRLIALWVTCEAFAGGILHGIRLPFSGMLVSSLAVFCIILISWYISDKGAIIKATIVVAIFKLMLSPHSPPTAYIAVFFQGITGQFLLAGKRNFIAKCMGFGFLALVESGIQRLLVLVIIYGTKFWDAVDLYLQKLLNSSLNNYSLWLAASYLLVHAITGCLVGYYAARIIYFARHQKTGYTISFQTDTIETRSSGRKKMKTVFIITCAILTAMLIHAWAYPEDSVIAKQEILMIILRGALIILTWYLVLSPLVMKFIGSALTIQRKRNIAHVQAVEKLLPSILSLFKAAWIRAKKMPGSRLKNFIRLLVINIIHPATATTEASE